MGKFTFIETEHAYVHRTYEIQAKSLKEAYEKWYEFEMKLIETEYEEPFKRWDAFHQLQVHGSTDDPIIDYSEDDFEGYPRLPALQLSPADLNDPGEV
jgi:hypothetical protein